MINLRRFFGYALAGIRNCFLTEMNFRIHLVIAFLVIIGGVIFRISPVEWLFILFCIASVLILEMLNTAIEKICNHIEKSMHPEIRSIKDISAGAVLVAAIVSIVAGSIIFLPKIIHAF